MIDLAALIWRDFKIDGNPASGIQHPDKLKIRSWGTWLESLLAAGALGDHWYSTKSAASLAAASLADGIIVIVYSDSTSTNNGVYRVISHDLLQIADFLPGWQVVRATATGASTANSYVFNAVPFVPATDAAVIIFGVIPATNTSGTVTATLNGGSPLAVKTATGNDPPIGGLPQGVPFLAQISGSGTQLRLMIDSNSAANAAAAETARLGAEAARDIALSAVPNAFSASRTAIAALDPATKPQSYLKESGREGQFVWNSANLTTAISTDTAQGDYIAPAFSGYATDGSNGAWQRIRKNGDLFKTSEYGDNLAVAVAVCAYHGGGTVEINKAGSFTLPPGFIKPANVEVVGLGSDKTKFVPTGFSADSHFINPAPTLMGGRMVMICADANSYNMTVLPSFSGAGVGESYLTFTAAHGLSVGEQVCIHKTAANSLNAYRAYYYAGERFTVQSIVGLKVYFDRPFQFAYTYGSTVKAYKVYHWGGKFGGFSIDLSDVYSGSLEWEAIKVFRAKGAEIDDIQIIGAKGTGIEFDQCLDIAPSRIHASTRLDGTQPTVAYPIIISNSTNVWVEGSGQGHWCGGDIGGNDVLGAVTNYNCGYRNFSATATVGLAAGMHGNTIECGYRDCKIDGGASWSGYGSYYENCQIQVYRGTNKILLYGTEVGGGRHVCRGGKLFSTLDAGSNPSFGAVTARTEASATAPAEFIIEDLSFIADSEPRPVYIDAAVSAAPVSFRMSNVRGQWAAQDSHGLVRAYNTGGAAPASFVINGVTGVATGKALYEFNSYSPTYKQVQGEPTVLTVSSGTSWNLAGVDVVQINYATPTTVTAFSNVVSGKLYTFQNVGTATVTIDRTSARLDGGTNKAIAQYGVMKAVGFSATTIWQASGVMANT